ncbi:bifunctional 4-hydroxy-2-oxoglutarate aldolase/2-dehydro-3-deoxy-phosphogluconate aldolase [Thermodesulfobacteriota bacterium]
MDVAVVGILRGVDSGFFSEILEVSFSAGLEALEVTMNTKGGEAMVEKNRDRVPVGKYLGMGTIRNRDEARRAIDAGAMFLVSPNLDTEVIEYAVSRRVPVIAGALTPTEVYEAWSAGASMIKVFPCGVMGGPQYIRELRGPFDDLPLIAVGGVTLDNLEEYFQAGVSGVGVSSSLFGKQAVRQKNPQEIARNVKLFIDRCHKMKDSLLSPL